MENCLRCFGSFFFFFLINIENGELLPFETPQTVFYSLYFILLYLTEYGEVLYSCMKKVGFLLLIFKKLKKDSNYLKKFNRISV